MPSPNGLGNDLAVPRVALFLASDGGQVLVQVWDGNPILRCRQALMSTPRVVADY
jgi:hypothetical protein